MPWDAEDAWGRQALPKPGRVTNTNALTERSQPLIDVVQLEFFEQVAKQCLRSDAVTYCASALALSYPEGDGTEFRFGEHVDVQYTLEQWEATPRRAIVSFFIWLADANAKRAPLMVRGCHLPASNLQPRLATCSHHLAAGLPVGAFLTLMASTVCSIDPVHIG